MPHHHCGYVPEPHFISHHPCSISSTSQAGMGSRIRTLVQETSFFFFFPWETCPPFHALLMEVEPLKHRPEVKRTLMGLPLHCPRFQCCLTPALPAGPAAHSVCQSVMQKLQKPCPAYCPYPLLCAWPRSQENHPAQGPHRELRLQLYHWARPYEKMLQALWLSPEHVSARVPGEQLLSLIPAYMLPWKEPGSQEL